MAVVNTRCDPLNYRIGPTLSGLDFFFLVGITTPSTANYQGFSDKAAQGDGGQATHGYKTVTLTWVNADPKTVRRVKQYVNQALSSTKEIYLTVPYNDGSVIGRTFIDIVGRPWPIEAAEDGIQGNWGMVYGNLTLFVNNVTIVNNPADL